MTPNLHIFYYVQVSACIIFFLNSKFRVRQMLFKSGSNNQLNLWYKPAHKTVREKKTNKKTPLWQCFKCAEKRNITMFGAVSVTKAWPNVTPDVSWVLIMKIRGILLPAIIDLSDLEWYFAVCHIYVAPWHAWNWSIIATIPGGWL